MMRFFRRQRNTFPRTDSASDKLAQLLKIHEITLIIDVGANEGQYGDQLRRHGYAGRIISFEPGTDAHEVLTNRARPDPHWDVAPRMALGSADGLARLQTSNRSDMNSLLTATEDAQAAFPKLKTAGDETVNVVRLDTVIDALVAPTETDRIFLKIDTQGYESHVLRGAENVMKGIAGLQVELSFLPLYHGECDYIELLKEIHTMGFEPHLFVNGFFSRALARQLQFDGIFFRT